MMLAGACISCGNSTPQPARTAAATATATPAVPDDIQSAAETALGSETDVLLFGDLAKNGHTQALAVNQLKVTPKGVTPGTLVTRAAVIENDGGTWKEIFRCDEHLKNTAGYLGGIPLAPVTAWRLQYEKDAEKGLDMFFTPLQKPAGGYVQTIEVRWNPKVNRYQSLDRSFTDFLMELPQLETPESQIRR
jgi:hypothetical protein